MYSDYDAYLLYQARLKLGLSHRTAMIRVMEITKFSRTQLLQAIAAHKK